MGLEPFGSHISPLWSVALIIHVVKHGLDMLRVEPVVAIAACVSSFEFLPDGWYVRIEQPQRRRGHTVVMGITKRALIFVVLVVIVTIDVPVEEALRIDCAVVIHHIRPPSLERG